MLALALCGLTIGLTLLQLWFYAQFETNFLCYFLVMHFFWKHFITDMPSLKLISSPRRDVWTMPEKGPKHLTIAYIPLILSSAQVVKPLADAFNSRAMPTMPSDAKNRIVRHIHTHIITRIDCTLCVQNKPWLSLYRSLSHTYCSMVCIIDITDSLLL